MENLIETILVEISSTKLARNSSFPKSINSGPIHMQIAAKSLFAKVLFFTLLTLSVGVFASAQTADVDAVVQKMIDAKTIPGAGVAVVRDGKVVLAKGYGAADLETGTPASENTVLQIASVTKQFTAAGIMLLVEDGKLKLDDPVGKYVTEVPTAWS